MYISRKIDSALIEWSQDPDHKPLLLRGARQTGKTTAVQNLGQKFQHYVEINLEQRPDIAAIFKGPLDIDTICAKLEIMAAKPIIPGKTLLFLDEILSCPEAIRSLRYFYENKQFLHVVAAGSLLEFAFSEISDFGVGRIRSLFLHPLSFAEFATASKALPALDHVRSSSFERPPFMEAHHRLLEVLKDFMLVGGMPGVVRKFLQTGSYLAARQEQSDILTSLKADFGKYKKRIKPELVRLALESIVNQSGSKFKYTDSELGLKYAESKICTDLLCQARLAKRVELCHANGLPLGADIDVRKNKFLFLDSGLYLCSKGLDLADWIADSPSDLVNRGELAEMFVGHELIKSASPYEDRQLFYWHREAKSSNAEVDYLVQHRNGILPIEVKSGIKGSMKSLGLLMQEKGLPLGIRTSRENFAIIDKVRIVPLYMIGELDRYL